MGGSSYQLSFTGFNPNFCAWRSQAQKFGLKPVKVYNSQANKQVIPPPLLLQMLENA